MEMMIQIFLLLFYFIFPMRANASNQTWFNQQDFSRRTTGISLNANKLRFNAEVVDFNNSQTQRRPGLDQFRAVLTNSYSFKNQFQAEVQGMRAQKGDEFANMISWFRNRNQIYKSDLATLSLQTQIFANNTETRQAIGLPLDLRLSRSDTAGISTMVEKGQQQKYVVNMYYSRKLLPGLTSNLGLYTEKITDKDGRKLSTMNADLNYQTRAGARFNIGTFATRIPGNEIIMNHILGTTIPF